MTQNEHKGKIRHGFSEKSTFGAGRLNPDFYRRQRNAEQQPVVAGRRFHWADYRFGGVVHFRKNGLACHGLSAVFSGRYFDYRFYSLCHRRL